MNIQILAGIALCHKNAVSRVLYYPLRDTVIMPAIGEGNTASIPPSFYKTNFFCICNRQVMFPRRHRRVFMHFPGILTFYA